MPQPFECCKNRLKHRRRQLKPLMKASLKEYHRRLYEPLRLIHPEHHEEPLYKTCYERFSRSLNVPCSPQVLQLVAKMPSLLRLQPRYKKKYHECESKENNNRVDGPSEDDVQSMDLALATLKPGDFDTAGIDDDESLHITEENLIASKFDRCDHLVLLG